jgi:hypothetical protein
MDFSNYLHKSIKYFLSSGLIQFFIIFLRKKKSKVNLEGGFISGLLNGSGSMDKSPSSI